MKRRGISLDAANVKAMFDTKRFSKIKSLQDIRLEKARLRYEMLTAENRLSDSLQTAGQIFSLSALMARVRIGMTVARKSYDIFSGLLRWVSGKRKKKKQQNTRDENKPVIKVPH
jgi:hypothetical protein